MFRRLRMNLIPAAIVLSIGALQGQPAAHAQCCATPDNGTGTATLPPIGLGLCYYVGTMEIVDGLDFGGTIQINATLGQFSNVVESPGGTLGGTTSVYDAVLDLTMTGTGPHAGFNRSIQIPLLSSGNLMDWAARTNFAPVQQAQAELMRLQGQITQDPDFDLLRVTGGTLFGLPSPGVIQLTAAGPAWSASGFFDVVHRIDFVGAPGGQLAGRSGSTTRNRRFVMCEEPVPAQSSSWGRIKALFR